MKQANVKMLSSALAPCVFFVFNQALGVCFYKQVEPHITCPTMVFDLILFFLITQLESPDLIYECTHLLSLFFFPYLSNVISLQCKFRAGLSNTCRV